MNIVSRNISKGVLIAAIMLSLGCRKSDSVNESGLVTGEDETARSVLLLRLRRIPHIPLPLARCIQSYDDIIDALGSSQVRVSKVVLSSGVVIEPGNDLSYITYEATASTKANCIFDSKLSVEWRFPGGNWQLSTADVWSLGCVYEQAGQPPFTNIIKGGDIILVNTCFYWSTNEHTGERVDYLVVE